MRGKDVLTDVDTGEIGITPAYAGKSKTSVQGCLDCRDPPRLCGEKFS